MIPVSGGEVGWKGKGSFQKGAEGSNMKLNSTYLPPLLPPTLSNESMSSKSAQISNT